jgi:hypothetical protein
VRFLGAAFLIVALGSVACSEGELDPLSPEFPTVVSPYPQAMPPAASTAPVAAVSYPAQAFLDRTLNLAFYTDEQLQDIAASPLALFQLRVLLSPEAVQPLATIRSYNPDIVILGILDTQSSYYGWNGAQHRERFPMSRDMYDLFANHWARRTDGALATKWEDAPMVNPWHPGETYNRELMLAQVDIICHWAAQFPDAIDGMWHDNVSINAYLWPRPANPETQQADFDRDGVGIESDPEDLAAWQGWQDDYVAELQSRFGSGFIQMGNGDRPLRDREFASTLAGVVLEDYPQTVWYYTYREAMELIYKIDYEGWVTARRGQTWSLLWDAHSRNPFYTRATSSLTDTFYALDETSGWTANDPDAKLAGIPLGDTIRTELGDGGLLFERPMSNGRAWAEFSSEGFTRTYGFEPQ